MSFKSEGYTGYEGSSKEYEKYLKDNNLVLNGFNQEVDRDEFEKATQEQVDDIAYQESLKRFRGYCYDTNTEPTYENYQKFHNEGGEDEYLTQCAKGKDDFLTTI